MSAEDACGCTTLVELKCERCPNDRVWPTWFPVYDRVADETSVDAKNAASWEQYEKDLEAYRALTPRQQKKAYEPHEPGTHDYWGYRKTYSTYEYDSRHRLDPAYDVEHMMYKCSACGYMWREAV
jgi:hypothetical protein